MTDKRSENTPNVYRAALHAHKVLGTDEVGRKLLGNENLGEKILSDFERTATKITELEEENVRDPLTGAFNRRHLEKELSALLLNKEPFALIFTDIDQFKYINDFYGHEVGDAALKHLVVVISNTIKVSRPEKSDTVAKYGGEEFVILLKGVEKIETAQKVAERVRLSIENSAFGATNSEKLRMTISLGVTLTRKNDTPDEILKRGDQAMYNAKRQGRNKVVVL